LTRAATVDAIPDYLPEQAKLTGSKIPHEWASRGMHITMLNHPDVNFEALADFIDSLPTEGRLNWTAAQAADWWARTHRRDAVEIEKVHQPILVYRVRRLPTDTVLQPRGGEARIERLP
jgi:hypothetical protein